MRRTLLAAVAAATIASPALAAPTSATITDKPNDWPVPSQDVRRVRSWSDGKVVKFAFDLSAAPDPTVRYQAFFQAGRCDRAWSVTATAVGTPAAQADLSRLTCDTVNMNAALDKAAAAVAVRGTTVEITAPYAFGLAHGMTIDSLVGMASAFMTGTYQKGFGQDGFVVTGDLVLGKVSYRLR